MSLSDPGKKSKTLKGKYQIKKDLFVTCYLDVVEASDHSFRTFVSLKKRHDTLVPVGTKLYFNAESIHKITSRRSGTFDIFAVTVTEIEDLEGKPIHVCTPINKESFSNRRASERIKTEFFLQGSNASGNAFIAENASPKGLKLRYKSKKAMLGLPLGQPSTFSVNYRGDIYTFSAIIKHIQYDWKTHEHELGVQFHAISDETAFVLQKLIDPDFTIDIAGKEDIDTAEGKVSRQHDEE